MDRLRAVFDRRRDQAIGRPAAGAAPPNPPIPAVIAERLIPDNGDEPLFPKLKGYGKGKPGVTQEREEWWVIRDDHGRVAGGAVVGSIGPDHPVSIDVAIDPARQGQGFGAALYASLEAAGINVEAGSVGFPRSSDHDTPRVRLHAQPAPAERPGHRGEDHRGRERVSRLRRAPVTMNAAGLAHGGMGSLTASDPVVASSADLSSRPIPVPPTIFHDMRSLYIERCIEPLLPDVRAVEAFHRALVGYLGQPDPRHLVRAVAGLERGVPITTRDGSRLIPGDNSPAWWWHAVLFNDLLVDPSKLASFIAATPFHMFKAPNRGETLNVKGWYVAHILGVKNRDVRWQDWPRSTAVWRFVRNIHPCNVFYVPKKPAAWIDVSADAAMLATIAAYYRHRYSSIWDEFCDLADAPPGHGNPAPDGILDVAEWPSAGATTDAPRSTAASTPTSTVGFWRGSRMAGDPPTRSADDDWDSSRARPERRGADEETRGRPDGRAADRHRRCPVQPVPRQRHGDSGPGRPPPPSRPRLVRTSGGCEQATHTPHWLDRGREVARRWAGGWARGRCRDGHRCDRPRRRRHRLRTLQLGERARHTLKPGPSTSGYAPARNMRRIRLVRPMRLWAPGRCWPRRRRQISDDPLGGTRCHRASPAMSDTPNERPADRAAGPGSCRPDHLDRRRLGSRRPFPSRADAAPRRQGRHLHHLSRARLHITGRSTASEWGGAIATSRLAGRVVGRKRGRVVLGV